jgi:hypothetical protein
MFRILENGTARSEGELVTLAARQSVWMPAGLVSDGLPIELADARPSGFLGRHFAAIHADLRLPARLMDWSTHHILLAMSRRGEDLPGNLIVGDESFARWQTLDIPTTARNEYPALAEATIAGHPPGSSAGGERPKFGAFVDGRHVLVKFAGRGGAGDAAVARRWCDLLVLEALALEVVSSRGVPAARTAIIETDSHYFLESDRFDRVGIRGRIAVLSLAAVQDDPADPWARAAVLLRDSGRLSSEDARRLRWLDAFGALIANTDRHFGNLACFDRYDGRFTLAPVYDMLPMLYAPEHDELPARTFAPLAPNADNLRQFARARGLAERYWSACAGDARITAGFRGIAAANLRLLEALPRTGPYAEVRTSP